MPGTINANDLGRVVRVDYDYHYKANDGNLVKIMEGEEFILIKKSNEDWWQVVKQEQKKPFYIPATYVTELQHKKFLDHPYFKKAHNALLKSQRNDESQQNKVKKTTQRLSDGIQNKERMIVVTGSREDLNVLSGFSNYSKFSEMRASTDSLDKFIENENPYDEVPIDTLSRPQTKKSFQSSSAHTEVKPVHVQYEDPDYENLEDFTSASQFTEKKFQEPDVANEKTRGSGNKMPPPVSQKPVYHKPDRTEKVQDDVPLYANMQSQAIKPALPAQHSPQSATTVEVFDDGWELQLDNQTGNKYYYNPNTGSMRIKPPRRHNQDSGKPSQVLTVPKQDTSPQSTPRSILSPEEETRKKTRPSPLQRRKTSPARFKNSQRVPLVKKRDAKTNEENVSPNENNCNNLTLQDRGDSHGRSEISREEKSGQWVSPLLSKRGFSHSRESSGSSRSLSPEGATLTTSQQESSTPTPAGWIRERSSDGDSVMINSLTGDRWVQLYDHANKSYYYFNELTRVTTWDLPLIREGRKNNRPGKVESPAYSPETSPRHDSSFGHNYSTKDVKKPSIRKSKTLDRNDFAGLSEEYADQISKSSSLPWSGKKKDGKDVRSKSQKSPPTPPPAKLKPPARPGTKHLTKRVLHSQSMIILDDSSSLYSSREEEQKPNETSKDTSSDRTRLVPPPHPMIERQGRLNWTKIAEAGKKLRKNWLQQWVVLLSHNLLFYKDQKQATVTKATPLGKPESSCELRGAGVEWAKEKSSKKNVFEVRTIRGLSFLLQHDDIITIREWFKSIESTIKRANQVEPLDHGLLSRKDSHGSTEDESMENHQSILDVKDKKKKKKDKKGKPPSRHGSDAKQSDKVRNKLRKFISKRPTMESLQERGLIKETVFGCPLDKLCEKEGSAVPKFVKMCVEEVEERGLNIDGIYRVSGNLSHVQKLRYMVDRDMVVNLKDPEWEDIHVITGALKMFLRELSEPVIPFQFFDKFIATCKISDVNSRLDATKSLIKAMPKPNKETLKYLMRHFCNVVSHSDANRMQVQNVAIVFGPTLLLKPPEMTSHYDPGGGNMAVYMMYQNQIVDYMLTDYDTLFS